ncbi:hypothetical protein EYS14_12840 [Alteromonadaceae bacterium M269]|nr:hypothetical protein EYS14_12840 [Alteromonadaceae bacterium M269]
MKKLISLTLLLSSFNALSSTICTGKINEVYFNPISAFVYINYGYGVNVLCSVEQESNRISPESCKTLYSGLLAAEAQGQTATIAYNGDFTCSTEELGHFVGPLKESFLLSYQ